MDGIVAIVALRLPHVGIKSHHQACHPRHDVCGKEHREE